MTWCATDACGGNVVGVSGESLFEEIVTTCTYHSCVLGIYIAHKEPCADTVVGKCCIHVVEKVLVGVEELECLLVAAAFCLLESHGPEMAIAIVLTDECALEHAHARTFLNIEPESDFGSIERRLLNVGDGAVFVLTKERHLVGGIGEEIALEDGVGSLEFRELEKLVFGSIDALHLCFESVVVGIDGDESMCFFHGIFSERENRQLKACSKFGYVKIFGNHLFDNCFVRVLSLLLFCKIRCKDSNLS